MLTYAGKALIEILGAQLRDGTNNSGVSAAGMLTYANVC